MNKYITALFVVLAATGVEAQTYKSALKAALENCSLEEIYHHVELCGIETELLPIIEAFKNIQKEKKKHQHIVRPISSFARIPHQIF